MRYMNSGKHAKVVCISAIAVHDFADGAELGSHSPGVEIWRYHGDRSPVVLTNAVLSR